MSLACGAIFGKKILPAALFVIYNLVCGASDFSVFLSLPIYSYRKWSEFKYLVTITHNDLVWIKRNRWRDALLLNHPSYSAWQCVCSAKTQKTENSNLYGFELHRPSSKGTKLLFQVIKAIMNHQCFIIGKSSRSRGFLTRAKGARTHVSFSESPAYLLTLSSLRQPQWGGRFLKLHYKSAAGYTWPLLFLFKQTQQLTPLTTRGKPWRLRVCAGPTFVRPHWWGVTRNWTDMLGINSPYL